jgi:heavy metal sensor kinase
VNPRSLRFRTTVWYAGLLAGALLLFALSLYLGLKRYLDWNLQKSLAEQCRSIGLQLLPELPSAGPNFLTEEINEAYAPEVNRHLIRVSRVHGGILYLSGPPKDGSFDPASVPAFTAPNDKEFSRKIPIPRGQKLLLVGLAFTNPDGARFLVESGVSYQQVENVLHGLLLTFAVYVPFIVAVAVIGGYWLMRNSLRPVDEITQRAEGITSTNLSQRLPLIKTGDELERLSTALNRMIARLEDAFRQANRFSADASHELRTPLTILQLELEAIAQTHRLPGDILDHIGSAIEETSRLSRIVENLLTISRLDAGEARMEVTQVDLGKLAAETVEQMKLLADEKSLSMTCDVSPDVYVGGDRSRLKQVIVNLIDNAIKYTPEGGDIKLKVRSDQDNAEVEISDTGAGIPPEAMPHIFERFYRADKARSRESGGAGLGLAIVKAICTAHGAEIKVTSTEGQGSRFLIALPLIKPADTQAQPASTPAAVPDKSAVSQKRS